MSNPEDDIGFTFSAGDGESWFATPENASLFLFAGDLALHDHVFIETDNDPDSKRLIGTYIFLITQEPETVEDIKEYMLNNGYQAHINLREVAECDRSAYASLVEQRVTRAKEEMGDFIPDGWQ